MSKLISKVVVPDPNEAGGYSLYNIKDADAIRSSEKGSNNGVATLNDSGKIPSSQLPSYVDDVIEGYYNLSNSEFYYDYSEKIDDAAREILGSCWRTPTADEILSLIDNTNITWSSDYQDSGVAGFVCTDKTDSSKVLFFPACGMCMGNLIVLSNQMCFYLSSSRDDSERLALCFVGDNNGQSARTPLSRYAGMPVRAVFDNEDSSQSYVEINGVKWATKNIGASDITDTGLYFLWGDVIGYTSSQVGTNKIFLAEYYKYFNVTEGQITVTKYNSTDGLTTLELDYSSKIIPEGGKIYIDLLTEKTYRWSGSAYTTIKGDVVIGTATGTAADGKVVNDHVTNTDIHITATERALWNSKYTKPSGGIPGSDLATSYLPLAGGTMMGVLALKDDMYEDSYGGALNCNNSNIYGVNSIYTADVSGSSSEGIHFYRDTTHVDTIWINNGDIYFTPNRELGTDGTSYKIWHEGNGDFAQKYSYSLAAGKTVKIMLTTYYQVILTGRATNGTSCDLMLIGTGYSDTNHWRALYKGNQVSWCTLSGERGIEIKNTHSEGTLYINILSLRGTPTFEEVSDLEGTAVTAVMALTTSTVAAADKLSTARTLWGLSFDGSANVSGNMTSVGTIAASGDISVTRTTTTASKLVATNSKGSVSLMTSTNRGVYDDTNEKWLITTNGTNTWLNCGNVAIDSAANTNYKLYVNGTVGATNFYTTSDRSKKENIEQFSEHISKFTLKETGKDAYGVIAQDVPEMFREGTEGSYTVNYASILSYYVGILENRVLKLEDELKELKKGMNNGTSIN